MDVIIVGGGLLGKAIAYQLAQQDLKIGIVYQRTQRHGQASAAAGAMLGVFSEVSSKDANRQIEVDHRWSARQLFQPWVDELRQASGLPIQLQEGLFVVANATGENDALEMQTIRETVLAYGCRAESVAPSNVPALASDAFTFDALFLPDEGSVDTAQLLDALDHILAQHPNVQIFDTRVTALRFPPGDQLAQVITAIGELKTKEVILAGGAEIPHLLHASDLLGLKIPLIFSGRGVSLLIRSSLNLPYTVRTPNRSFACGLHLVPRANGEIYLGATNRLSTTPDFGQLANLSEVNNLLTGGIHEINTALRSAEILSIAVGHRPVTLDKLPLIGRTAEPRLLLATGTYRNGVLLAPLLAKMLAEEVQQPGQLASHPFAVHREMQLPSQTQLDKWLAQVSHELIGTLLEPNGMLPYGREKDLQHFFEVMFNWLFNADFDSQGLQRKTQAMFQRAPLAENIPLLFEMIARHHSG